MSDGYNDRLTEGVWRGTCGKPEIFDKEESIEAKIDALAQLLRDAKHVVVHTGAGISTSVGIPDFRGPTGVWTLEMRGLPIPKGKKFENATPSPTHMALVALMREGIVDYIISQNVDGLHLRTKLSELHGNVFKEICAQCQLEYYRGVDVGGMGLKPTGRICDDKELGCGGPLRDHTLDWNDRLPDYDLDLAETWSKKADLGLCLGTSLQIRPACNLPVRTLRKNGKPKPGKLAIVNLQRTQHDRKAEIRIHEKCDRVMLGVLDRLGIALPEWHHVEVPCFRLPGDYKHIVTDDEEEGESDNEAESHTRKRKRSSNEDVANAKTKSEKGLAKDDRPMGLARFDSKQHPPNPRRNV